jgi:hypothetical protein
LGIARYVPTFGDNEIEWAVLLKLHQKMGENITGSVAITVSYRGHTAPKRARIPWGPKMAHSSPDICHRSHHRSMSLQTVGNAEIGSVRA